ILPTRQEVHHLQACQLETRVSHNRYRTDVPGFNNGTLPIRHIHLPAPPFCALTTGRAIDGVNTAPPIRMITSAAVRRQVLPPSNAKDQEEQSWRRRQAHPLPRPGGRAAAPWHRPAGRPACLGGRRRAKGLSL